MAANSERDAGYRMARAVILTLLWVLFITALVMSARQGVVLAEARLSQQTVNAILPAPGVIATVDATSAPAAFGESAEALREYFLNFAVRGGADSSDEHPEVRLLSGTFTVHVLQEDGILVRVRIADGGRRGEVYWVSRDRIRLSD